jgi:hypothetical protein
MPVTPERAKISRRRRTDQFLNSLAKLIGCSALVTIVAAVFYVAAERLMRPANDELAYLQEYEDEISRSNWSGNKESQPALMSRDVALSSAPEVFTKTGERVGAGEAVGGVPVATPVVSGITNLEEKRPMIEAAVRKFFEAETVSGKLPYVRDAARVKSLMEDYYNRNPMPKPKWQELGWTRTVDEKGYRLGYVQAAFSDGERASLIVEETVNGSFLVDWESYVRYGELDWREFLEMKPVQPTLFRVIASKAEGDEGSKVAAGVDMIEIKHPAADGKVYATLDREDPRNAGLVEQLKMGKWKDVPLTLRLCYPGTGGDSKAVRIAGVEGKGWLILQNKRS